MKNNVYIHFDIYVHHEVVTYLLGYAKWLETKISSRLDIYIKSSFVIQKKSQDEKIVATFYAPDSKKDRPYIKVAAGDYPSLKRRYEYGPAITMLSDSLSHEIIHYFQWFENKPLNKKEADTKAFELTREYLKSTDFMC